MINWSTYQHFQMEEREWEGGKRKGRRKKNKGGRKGMERE
jgi:hypothetical protein